MTWAFILLSLTGINYTFWALMGFLRLVAEETSRLLRRFGFQTQAARDQRGNLSIPTINEVAAIVPAHNEEAVIGETLERLLKLLPATNIHLISDGSVDTTAAIARQKGVTVLELHPAHGKAGAIQTGIAHFQLVDKFKIILLVDADTILSTKYLTRGLKYFADPEIVAVAGFAKTLWPHQASISKRYFLAYRERVYLLAQTLLKFGQTWKKTNVSFIVPGFASMYRASIVPKIKINPPGLVIEDFNMTFEIHHQGLGKIAHVPHVYAYTQDPNNLRDYYRQVRRWDLGFWQTWRRHGVWRSFFSLALTLLIVELVLGFIIFLGLPIALTLAIFHVHTFLTNIFTWQRIVVAILLPDYLLTVIAAAVERRPSYLFYGLGFIFLRVVDALAYLGTLFQAYWGVTSNGRWKSPVRRAMAV